MPPPQAGRITMAWIRQPSPIDCRGRFMSHSPEQTLDEATLEFAEQVFNSARSGDSARLDALLSQGLAPNLRNHNGDSLLMLASYHGHLQATQLLLHHQADPQL